MCQACVSNLGHLCEMMPLSFSCVVEQKVPLGEACTLDDICLDADAVCSSGFCVCEMTHYNDNGRCGRSHVLNHVIGLFKMILRWFFANNKLIITFRVSKVGRCNAECDDLISVCDVWCYTCADVQSPNVGKCKQNQS